MDITVPELEDYLDFEADNYSGAAYLLQEVIKETENVKMAIVENQHGNIFAFLSKVSME